MFMVIYWHVMSCRPGFSLPDMPSYAANFIIPVNMPLFFVVSGYFARGLHEDGSHRKLLNRFISYFWPMAVFAAFFTLVDGFVLAKFAIHELLVRAVKNFLFSSWFFQALAICEIITFYACRFKNAWQRVAVCSLGYILCLLGAGHVWYVACVPPLILFYWLGLWILPKVVFDKRIFFVCGMIGCMMLVAATFMYGNVATNGLAFYWDRFDIWNPRITNVVNQISRLIVGAFGSVFIIWVVKVLSARFQRLAWFAVLGTETLGIYFLQSWFIRYMSNPFVSLSARSLVLMISSCIVFGSAFIVVRILKMNRIVGGIVFGFRI